MRIIILQGAFLPIPPVLGGGVEKVWFKIGKEFAAAGHEVIHISKAMPGMPSSEVIDGVKHIRVKGYGTPSGIVQLKMLDLLYTLRAVCKIPKKTPQVIITNTFWAPVIIRKRTNRAVYVDVQRMPKGQMKYYSKARRLRANSSSVSMAIVHELGRDERDQVVMIPNPLPFDVSEQIDFNRKQKIILYVGRIHPEKGLHLLINAAKIIAPGWKLKIVGPFAVNAGGGGEDYLNELKVMSDGLDIEFAGPVFDMEKLNNYYREASIFVYPSVAEKGETFGIAPLEAMAWGCAPVVSNLACFRDFITSNENGLIFDHRSSTAAEQLAKNITALQSDKSLCIRLGEKAINVRQTHSGAAIARQFLEEFSSIIKNNK